MGDLTLREWFEDACENGLALTTRLARISLTATQMDGVAPPAEPEPVVERWQSPIGDENYPSAAWYVAVVHDLTGRANNGYRHTGIDLNLARQPYGDVDRYQPVFAVADGKVHRTGYSDDYLGSVIVEVAIAEPLSAQAWSWQNGAPANQLVRLEAGTSVYVRYWHLVDGATFLALEAGQPVEKGQCLGHLGNYTRGDGGDHCHFDMALDPFEPHWWFLHHPEVRWIDPLPVLAQHLGADLVDLMVSKELG